MKDELTSALFECETAYHRMMDAGNRANIRAFDAARDRFQSVRGDLVDALAGLLDALPSATTHPAITKARAALAKMGVDP
ncbi:hypothetical protein [Orrella marina]|uniref:Uncharacterized protein n=1 Tax=Orrella marina TaxID=2163011 RepID=A0A2R4XNY4_9BURK|nr:hypothetical protein [Orrella marina]AWB35516.1 hypothetical protein DBV39_19180 [Orrella marina]